MSAYLSVTQKEKESHTDAKTISYIKLNKRPLINEKNPLIVTKLQIANYKINQ